MNFSAIDRKTLAVIEAAHAIARAERLNGQWCVLSEAAADWLAIRAMILGATTLANVLMQVADTQGPAPASVAMVEAATAAVLGEEAAGCRLS